MIQETYPSGRVVRNDYEADGDLSRIYGKASTPNATERTYANAFTYTADGKIEKLRLGNNRWEWAKFNERLQVTELALGRGVTDASLWHLKYEYGELESGAVNTAKNTGNIARQTISFNGLTNPLVQTFKYDSLYRLTEARETDGNGTNAPQTWKEAFNYDRYGNRTDKEKFVGTTQIVNDHKTHPTIDPLTNRFNTQGYEYDKNGNLTQDAEGRVFVFNGENKQRLVAANGQNVGEYFYDGEGKRVKKKAYDNGGVTEETVFVYSASKLVAEYSTKPPPSNPTTNWTVTDQLGSPRVIVNSLGEVVSRRDFLPFGEESINNTGERPTSLKYGVADNVRQKFTGYQKDDETGLDFAEARMYENRHGRFTAVDPLLASGKSANPQTFNRFVYVINNPIIFTDPDGLQVGTANNNRCPNPCANSAGTVRDYADGSAEIFPNKSIAEVTINDDGNQSLLETENYATTISNSVLNQPRLSFLPQPNPIIGPLLGGFPANPWEQAGRGFLKGAANAPIDLSNLLTTGGLTYLNNNRLPTYNPFLIQRYGCSTRIECSWSTGTTMAAPFAAGVATLPFRAASSLSVVPRTTTVETGGLNLFKLGSPQAETSTGWKSGDKFFKLYDQGTVKLNWKQNSSFLRSEMRLGKPIFDSYRKADGTLQETRGFLNAERNLLQSRGWTFNIRTGAWMPPQ